VPEQDRSRLFLFVLGVAAVHALCLAAILPALISLPGSGTGITQDSTVKQDALLRDTIVNVEVLPSASPQADSYRAGAAAVETVTPAPSSAASLASTPDPSDVTSALPDIPQNADPAPGDRVNLVAPVAAATSTTPDLVGNASPPPSSSPPPPEDPGTVSAADPTPTNAIPTEAAKPATTVALPTEKPADAAKPALKPRTTAAKTAKPAARRQASVATKTQTRGMFGGFFSSKPRPKAQRTTTSR
jgi:hypothetical protein